MDRAGILGFLASNKELLKTRYHVDRIGLFGSYARNEQTADSDVDLVVDMPPSFDGYYDLKEFLESGMQARVDLGFEKNLRTLVRQRIIDEVIYV